MARGARADAGAVRSGGEGGSAAGGVSHGHGHSRLAESGGRGGAGGPTCACTQTMTVLNHSFKWLRVLGTAELTQIDQRVRQQLQAIVPLLDAFKSEQQSLAHSALRADSWN